MERVPAPHHPLELSLDSFLSCLSFLSLESGTQVTAAAPELWCRGEAGGAHPVRALPSGGCEGGEGEKGHRAGHPACPGDARVPRRRLRNTPFSNFPSKPRVTHPGEGAPHASPSVPWGRSLTGSAAGAPTLAAAIHPGRRSRRRRDRGVGEGEEREGPERRERRGGEGVATPQRLSRPCPTPPPASSPLLSSLFPALDPPKFFWCLILHSLLSSYLPSESPAPKWGERVLPPAEVGRGGGRYASYV